jgi:anthranilate phosphoribosyltransferase
MPEIEPWPKLLEIVARGHALDEEQSAAVIGAIMQGELPDDAVARFLIDLRNNGETAAEIAGAARAMRANMRAILSPFTTFVDTCGTGGDGAKTFNISTAAAIVTAAAGIPVAKHGNRSISSRSGSADVLASLGVNISAELPVVERCLRELRIGFCFAPLFHPAMKRVAEVRKSLGVPTIFNLLGPLANPANAPHQVLGVGKPHLRPLLAEALQRLGTVRSVVVSGADGLDEVTLATATNVSLVEPTDVVELQWSPEAFGLTPAPLDSMLIDGPKQSADLIRRILNNEAGAPRDIVVLNSAAALWTAGHVTDPLAATHMAQEAIASGKALELLQKLAALSHSEN